MMSLLLFGLVLSILLMVIYKVDAQPSGANVTVGQSSRGNTTAAQTVNVAAGNITPLNIDVSSITDIWQGFYGNVSGTIVLENANADTFYDWSITAVTGEVYATRTQISDWTAINCTNSTMWELEETALNIPSTAVDGINETYSQFNHPSFFVGLRQMTNCPSTRPYNSTGSSSAFWNVLLNSDATNTVYTSILVDNQNTFDNSTADFELLVPANRTTGTALYYFYAELV